MILYHGSNVEIREPKLLYSRTSLDFGAGFYTTTDMDQAEKWARHIARIRQQGTPIISVFELENEQIRCLSILKFERAERSWLDFVVKNRTGQIVNCSYDIIAGPIANDRTVDVQNSQSH